jgi:ATP-binding cassette subfamily B protein
MLFIALVAFKYSNNSNGVAESLPILALLVMASQRLLPILQNGYISWAAIKTGESALIEIVDLLKKSSLLPDVSISQDSINFSNSIKLSDINFRYDIKSPLVLNKINFIINKGEFIGIIGPTGSGKSTLTDLLMGLLNPTAGNIYIDNVSLSLNNLKSWQSKIAHVPQSIYISDLSILENIAFGIPSDLIDINRVKECARQAQISDVIECLPNNYRSLIGERGVRLSGGQRQRLGIARALYKRSELLILDEATSSLDSKTEDEVMRVLDYLPKSLTVIIIAHRLSTIIDADKI